MKSVGLIPARGGSKGLPGKNLRPLGGKPLIAWTVEAALESGVLDRVIVSTDDPAMAKATRQAGAETPFMRPPGLAADESSALDVALHALDWLKANESEPDVIVWLQPTSPFRSAADIVAGIRLLEESNASAVMGVTMTKAHPLQALTIDADGFLKPYLTNPLSGSRRQDLPAAYQINGALYIVRTAVLRAERKFLPAGTRPYLMPPERSLDIDTAWEFFLAECWVRNQTA